MNATLFRIPLAAALCSALAARPAAAEVVTLESLETALLERPVAAWDEARVRGASAQIRRAAAAYQPQVGLKGAATLAPGRFLVPVQRYPAGQGGDDVYLVQGARALGDSKAFASQLRLGLELSASANLYDFGRTANAVEAGRASKSAAGAAAAAGREASVLELREAYLGWLTASEQARLSRAARDDARGRLERARALVEGGVRPKADVAPTQTEALLAELECARSEGAEGEARLRLEDVAQRGLPPGAEPDTALLDREPGPAGRASAEDRALAHERDAALAAARAAARERLPQLSLAGSFGLSAQGSRYLPSYSAGLVLSMPLWDGGLSSAVSDEHRAQGDEIEARRLEERQERAFSEKRARLLIAQATEQIAAARALLSQCQQRLGAAEDGYKLGAVSLEQVHAARAVLRRAESEVLGARVGRARAMLQLLSPEGK